jgi:ADP-ribosylglycohydrolase
VSGPTRHCHITDDTQMTLFGCEALLTLDAGGSPDLDALTSSFHLGYLRWYATQAGAADRVPWPDHADPSVRSGGLLDRRELWARRAPGVTTMSALASGVCGSPLEPTNDSKGCGTVMRCAPLALLDEPWDATIRTSAITHGHPLAGLAAAFQAQVLHRLLRSSPLDEAIASGIERLAESEHRADISGAAVAETRAAVQAALTLAEEVPRPTPAAVEQLGGGWVADEALAIALYAACTATDLGSGVLTAVNHSGDSDSTAAMAGNLLGALHGAAAIPAAWIEALDERSAVESMADAVVDRFG